MNRRPGAKFVMEIPKGARVAFIAGRCFVAGGDQPPVEIVDGKPVPIIPLPAKEKAK